MKLLSKVALRFALVWAFEALALLVLHWAVPGITLDSDPGVLVAAMSVALF